MLWKPYSKIIEKSWNIAVELKWVKSLCNLSEKFGETVGYV